MKLEGWINTLVMTAAFATSSLRVFNAVFGEAAQLTEESILRHYHLAEDEQIVASVRFSSDAVEGRAFMILRTEDMRQAVEAILSRFCIKTPVEDSAVFAELINIYVANLIADLLCGHQGMMIEVPDKVPAGKMPDHQEEMALVRLRTESGLSFTFCYSINTRKQEP